MTDESAAAGEAAQEVREVQREVSGPDIEPSQEFLREVEAATVPLPLRAA